MCGICGIIDYRQHLPSVQREGFVTAMNQAIWHRGPDDAGTFSDINCNLAMRRLAIIDLEKGQQPIFNERGNIGVFLNGEIYNYPELKNKLLQRGHLFQTESDTEVLVHLYEEYHTGMLQYLKGMFAFCLFDLSDHTFFLARDRFGEKPLFYHWDNGVFSFSSEIPSLLENKCIERRINQEALPYYFRTSLVPEPLTLLAGVKSLLPGHFIRLQAGKLEISPYFQISYHPDPQIQTDEDAIAFIAPPLKKAVSRQSISDVPIGAFLSGGIDSSSVVALLQEQSAKAIKTFHVRFENQEYDESKVAAAVAAHCGTDHHELVVPNYHFTENIFWEIIEHVGLPFRDSSAIPTYMISKEIRKHVKVALSGDGGDELFGGYDLFRWYQKIMDSKKIPTGFRKMGDGVLSLAQKIPGLAGVSKFRQVKRALRTSLEAADVIPISLNEMFTDQGVDQLLHSYDSIDHQNYGRLRTYPPEARGWSSLRKIMYYRALHTLPANMLVKVDRMSMAHSLEVRAPFLDPDLFDASAQLPDKFLIRNNTGKYIIRKIMEQHLPPVVFNSPKQGFAIPLHQYQNEAFKHLARRLLYEENPFPEMLSPNFIDEIYCQGIHHANSNATLSVFKSIHRLWMLMQLFGWAKRFKVNY